MLAIDGIEIDRDQGRVPVIAVNQIRAEFFAVFGKGDGAPRE